MTYLCRYSGVDRPGPWRLLAESKKQRSTSAGPVLEKPGFSLFAVCSCTGWQLHLKTPRHGFLEGKGTYEMLTDEMMTNAFWMFLILDAWFRYISCAILLQFSFIATMSLRKGNLDWFDKWDLGKITAAHRAEHFLSLSLNFEVIWHDLAFAFCAVCSCSAMTSRSELQKLNHKRSPHLAHTWQAGVQRGQYGGVLPWTGSRGRGKLRQARTAHRAMLSMPNWFCHFASFWFSD